jgi:AraC family transcriptional regulator
MNAPSPTPSPIAQSLSFIDAHLFGDLSLADIAAAVDLSPYHFSRLFSAVMGESPVSYVRRRRLAQAALRLMQQPDTRLIDLAFECGFESQEAFTRAFRRTLGLTPGELRRGSSFTRLHEVLPEMTSTTLGDRLTVDPVPRKRAAFRVAGLSGRFDRISRAAIPTLWTQLVPRLPLPGQTQAETYGICRIINPSEGSFSYMAGVAVAADVALPRDIQSQEIPSQTYRVFCHALDRSNLHLQIVAAMQEIWSQRLRDLEVELVAGPDFEFYPPDFRPDRPTTIEYWIPVVG